MLRGNSPARIDEKGRLKIPSTFRSFIEQQYGRDVYITSLSGDSVRIYPMAVWLAVEQRIAAMPSTHPSRAKFLDRVNYFGQVAQIDTQGRVVIHQRLRDSAEMAGEVDVFGQYDYLDIWNHERFTAKLIREPYTDEDARALAQFGI